MYEAFYKLTTKPFRLSPDPTFFYPSHGHKRALSYLLYGLNQGEGFVVITGAPGTGKTTLSHKLLSQIDEQTILVAHLASTQIEAEDLLRLVAAAFKLRSENVSKAGLLRDIESFLLARARENKRCLLVVDEAQNLPPRSMEELRMLSNFQTGSKALLQIFLLGQQQFRTMLNDPDFEQLRQRVIADYHLNPMDMDETRHYIDARLQTTGWQNDPLFDSGAYASIYEYTSGLPRRINMFCDRLMLYGYLEGLHLFTRESVLNVVAELENEAPFPNHKQATQADNPVPRIIASLTREAATAPHSGAPVGTHSKPVLVSATARPKPVAETTSSSASPYAHAAASARAPARLTAKEELLASPPRAPLPVQPTQSAVQPKKSESLREFTTNTNSKMADNLLADYLSEDLLAQHESAMTRKRGRLASLVLTESQWLVVLVIATIMAALLILTFWVYPMARNVLYPPQVESAKSSDTITTDISDLLHKQENDTEVTGAVERSTETKSTSTSSALGDDTGATLMFADKSLRANTRPTPPEDLDVITRGHVSKPIEKRTVTPPRIPETSTTTTPPIPVAKPVAQEPIAPEIIAPPPPPVTTIANVTTPAPSSSPSSDISERELALLLVKFSRFYEQGDLTGFLKLFDPQVKTEDHNDIAAVSNDYSALFKKTFSREIVLGDISWATVGEQMQGFGSFEVRIRGAANGSMSVLKGTITFQVQRKDGRLVITQLHHKPG